MRYNSLNSYLKQTFGTKVYKLAISGGMTCPNRDGTVGVGGCIFCSEGGSGDFTPQAGCPKVAGIAGSQSAPCLSYVPGWVAGQIAEAKKKVARKMPTMPAGESGESGKYIAYFQSFTNTYAPVPYLRSIFTEALAQPDIVALSIATRPDCLGEDVLDLLEELNREKPIWVELGLQTIHEDTALYIRRGYDLTCFDNAVASLKARGLQVIVHVILGLPGEDKEKMLQTVRYVGACGANGIKLQLLHVLQHTDLALEYAAGKVPMMSQEEYIDLVIDCLEALPPSMVIHRLTGDGPKNILIAPLWSGNKRAVRNALTKRLEERDARQGKK